VLQRHQGIFEYADHNGSAVNKLTFLKVN